MGFRQLGINKFIKEVILLLSYMKHKKEVADLSYKYRNIFQEIIKYTLKFLFFLYGRLRRNKTKLARCIAFRCIGSK